jgi:hypothetical protein
MGKECSVLDLQMSYRSPVSNAGRLKSAKTFPNRMGSKKPFNSLSIKVSSEQF